MKEWILKHPVLTFLLAACVMSEVGSTIRAFAPNAEDDDAETEVNEEALK